MAIFMLETDAVSSGATSLTSIASQITSIGSAVSGYDTTCEDFDFGSAKAAIASNIEAMPASLTAASAIGEIFCKCARAAISGTTPP